MLKTKVPESGQAARRRPSIAFNHHSAGSNPYKLGTRDSGRRARRPRPVARRMMEKDVKRTDVSRCEFVERAWKPSQSDLGQVRRTVRHGDS